MNNPTPAPAGGDGMRVHDQATGNKQQTAISKLRVPGSQSALARFSLRDATDELEAIAAKQKPLLGETCLTTQATALYAKPNVGKTLTTLALTLQAIVEGRVEGNRTFYVAADDNPAGVLEKQRELAPFGVHVIAPGLKDFSMSLLRAEIERMIADGTAQGSFIILDTIKKGADLMDKKSSSDFANLIRRYVMAGGSFLGLAHTNKRAGADGRPIYGGTSDIVDDFDCAYTITEIPQTYSPLERFVQFDCLKRRGNVADQVVYRYSIDSRLTYAELLKSVRKVEPDELDRIHDEAERAGDADVIATVQDCIREGITSKQDLKKEGARRARVGHHKVSEIIERYTGNDPEKHCWTYEKLGRGLREYRLIGPAWDGPGDPSKIY